MKIPSTYLSLLLPLIVSAAAALVSARADFTVGINFTGANASGAPTSLAPDEVAGVVPQASWNNFGDTDVTNFPLRDSSGTLTAITIAYLTGEMWGSGAYSEASGTTTADAKLLNGYLNARTAATESTNVITIKGLDPGATYSLIAYTLRDNPNAQAAYWIDDDFAAAYHIRTEGGANWQADPHFRRSLNTTVDPDGFVPDDPANYGNYVRWDDVSPKADGSLTVSVASEPNALGELQRGPINGIQLISSAGYPPNTQTPQFLLQPRDVRVRLGQSGTFRATVDGPWTFRWYRNNVAVAGATGGTFTTAPISGIEDTRVDYKVTVSNEARTLTSAIVNLILVPELPPGGIFYDGFNYPEGDLGNWGEWNETNPRAKLAGAGTAKVRNPGLTYLDESGRALEVSGGALVPPREPSGWNSPDYLPIKAFEIPQGGPDTTIFMSFLFDFSNRAGGSGGIGFSGFDIVSGSALDWGQERFWVGTRGTVLGFDSGLPNSPNSDVSTAQAGFVVVRLTQDDTSVTADMFFNPPLDALPETPTYGVTRGGSVIFNGVGVNAGDWNTVEPANPGPLIDEFRFGTSYASVAPLADDRPILAAALAGTNIRVSWSPATPGYILEMTDSLAAGSWGNAPAGNPALIPITGSARFFRLKR